MWLKFDFYFEREEDFTSWYESLGIIFGDDEKYKFEFSSSSSGERKPFLDFYRYNESTDSYNLISWLEWIDDSYTPDVPFIRKTTALLHLISDSENGLAEIWVDGQKYCDSKFADEGLVYKGNFLNGVPLHYIEIERGAGVPWFSNIIISDQEIGLDENVSVAR